MDTAKKIWLIICAFAVLAVFGVVVWFIFSGRADQKIHGDNLEKFTESSEPASPKF